MMINIATYIAGFVFIFLTIYLKKYSVLAGKSGKCDVGIDDHGTLVAKCNHRGISTIPQNLDKKIQVLDISDNENMTLSNDDLKIYPNIWAFTMMNIHNITSIPTGFFQHTKTLWMLNISNTRISEFQEIPPSVTVLNYSHCEVEDMHLPQLKNLEKLYLKDCKNIKKIPTMPLTAPLKVLDMRYCPLTEAHYSQIAPYCQLEYFGLHSTEISSERFINECCGLRRWSRLHHITGYIAQECYRDPIRYPACSSLGIAFDDDAEKAYDDCLAPLRRPLYIKIGIGVAIVVIIVILIGSPLTYFYIRKKLKSHKKQEDTDVSFTLHEIEAEYDLESVTTTSPSDEG